jgi:hypothetical protein
MSTVCFSCTISSSDPAVPLTLRIVLDSRDILNLSPVPENYKFEYTFDDSDDVQQHVMEFVLDGKLPEHTVVDEQGNIVSDVTVTVDNKAFESVTIDGIFNQTTAYHHDFNGSQEPIIDEFFGTLGCNGRAEFRFTTPIYLWMLENL